MSNQMISLLLEAFWQTVAMIVVSCSIAVLLGLPLGVLLFVTRNPNILPGFTVHRILAVIINGIRSIPFIILMVAITPFTRLITGTSIGTEAAMVPLTIAAIPFFARLVESALEEIPFGLIEASQAMGATPWQIISKVLVPEALPSIIRGITLTLITLVGYSAMAGAIGGGGLGDLAIRYGYQRFDATVMLYTVVILIILVQVLQWIGDRISKHLSHRRGI